MLVAVAAASARCHNSSELHTAPVPTGARGREDFFRLPIQKAQAYSAMAHNAFQMAAAAATTEVLIGIERHHGVAALPYSVGFRIMTEANSHAERPNPDQLVQTAVRRGDPGRDGIGIIGNGEPRFDAVLRQSRAQGDFDFQALELRQIGRIEDGTQPDDAGKGEADRLYRSLAASEEASAASYACTKSSAGMLCNSSWFNRRRTASTT